MEFWRNVNWLVGSSIIIGTVYLAVSTPYLQFLGALVIFLSGLFVIPPINDKIQNRMAGELEDYLNPIIPFMAIALVSSAQLGIFEIFLKTFQALFEDALAPLASIGLIESDDLYYSDFSEEELRANSTNLTEIGYNNILRDYSSYQNDIIRLEGKVGQVRSQNDGYMIMIETNYDPGSRYTSGSYRGDRVWVEHEFDQGNLSIDGDRPVEDMVIEVLGEYLGPREYETAIGSTNTVPRVSLWYAK